MPKQKRVAAGTAFAKHLPSTQSRADLHDRAIVAATLRKYEMHIATIIAFLRERKLKTNIFTLEMFGSFLLGMEAERKTNSYNTATSYRSAVLHYQRSRDWGIPDGVCWAESPEAKRMVSGFAYNGRKPSSAPKRATMEPAMFAAFLSSTKKTDPSLAVPIEIAYRLALRPRELCSLSGGCLNVKKRTLNIPDKRANAANRRPHTTNKKVVDARAFTLLSSLESTYERHAPFFYTKSKRLTPEAFRRRFTAALVKSGVSDRLETGLILDGPHTLRHGGMSHLKNLLKKKGGEESVDNEIMRILQVTKSTMVRYTKSNKDRSGNKV